MKLKLMCVLLTIIATGCGSFTTGEGVFNGRIVDVSWGGLIFKSCEVDFQYGEQSSTVSTGSTRNKALCDKMKTLVGKVTEVKYMTWVKPCCLTLNTRYEIF